MIIYTFTRNGTRVPKPPNRKGLDFKHIKFDSTLLDDLMLIAKYRIVDFPTSIIIDDHGKMLLKVRGSIPGNYVDSLLNS